MLPFASGLAQPSRPDVFRPLAVDQRHGHRLTESVCDYIHYCIVKVSKCIQNWTFQKQSCITFNKNKRHNIYKYAI